MSEVAWQEKGSGSALPRVARSTLNEDVYTIVRTAILDGRLSGGARIVEERLAAQLGVSRAPLREALWQLKADGLIIGSGRQTRVVALSQRDVHELHLMRMTLETVLYQSASALLTEHDVAALEALADRMATEPAAIPELDLRFHRILCDISDLGRLRDVWEEQHVLFRLWLNLVAEEHEDPGGLARAHRTLLEAIVSRDPVRIAVETSNHIYRSAHALVDERRRWQAEDCALGGDAYGVLPAQAARRRPDARRDNEDEGSR
jgi:DNA-binding GntR family transcriptional regulator